MYTSSVDNETSLHSSAHKNGMTLKEIVHNKVIMLRLSR